MMISYKLLESQWLMIYLFVCPTTAFTQEVILGTTNDQLYETTIEERQKGEISEAPVWDHEALEPFIGV